MFTASPLAATAWPIRRSPACKKKFGLAPLIGKPLAFITDARLGSRSNQAAITERLLSISGEDAQTIDRKHIDAWTGRLSDTLHHPDQRTAAHCRRQRRAD